MKQTLFSQRRASARKTSGTLLWVLMAVFSVGVEVRAQWATNGTNINNTNTGNVGVGTTAPQVKLDVVGSSAAAVRAVRDNASTDSATAAAATIQLLNPNTTDNNFAGLAFQTYDSVGGTARPGAFIKSTFKSRTSTAVIADLGFSVANGGSVFEAMRIAAGGNVGIGTTAPAYRLDVSGQVRSSSGGFVFPDGSVQASAATGTVSGVTAGAGLTGGGSGGPLTLNVGAGTGLTAEADAISVNYGSAAGTAVQGNTTLNVTAGTGMSGGGQVTLGAGGSLTLTNDDRGSTQNIFKGVANAAGAVQFTAGSNSDAISFEGTGGTTVIFNAAAKKVTINSSASAASGWTDSGTTLSPTNLSAKVGIGTGTPAAKLDVNTGTNTAVAINAVGAINATGAITGASVSATYQDVAEWVPSTRRLAAGTVVVLDTGRNNHVMASAAAYDTKVAGVISAEPGIILGVAGENKVKVATTGRVKVRVDASCGAIKVGDLLVTSEVEGVAMKSVPVDLGGTAIHRPGTIIGKALEPLASGTGEILVLLSLQ